MTQARRMHFAQAGEGNQVFSGTSCDLVDRLSQA